MILLPRKIIAYTVSTGLSVLPALASLQAPVSAATHQSGAGISPPGEHVSLTMPPSHTEEVGGPARGVPRGTVVSPEKMKYLKEQIEKISPPYNEQQQEDESGK
jgi:hypothetical protein